MTAADAVTAPSRWARGMSLRARVLVGLALIALVATVSAVTVTVTTRHYLVTQLDERLLAFSGQGHPAIAGDVDDALGGRLPAISGDDDDAVGGKLPITAGDIGDRPSDALVGVWSADGNYRVTLSPNVYGDETAIPQIDVSQLSTTEMTYVTVPSSGDEEYRVLAKPMPGGWDITALSLESVEAVSNRLVLIEAVGIMTLIGGLGLVGWWVIRLGITPMRRMVDASAQIAEGDLTVRLDGAGSGTESAELAASLNAMIGRLSDSISERERSEVKLREFVADASHELRTPLTTVLGYAQLFRRGAIDGKVEQTDAWARTEAEAGRMKRLVEDMLELARYDAEPELHLAPTDVNRLVTEVLADANRAHQGVTFVQDHGPVKAEVEAPAIATVDADRVRQAVINVVNNAAQHGAENVSVAVRMVEDGGVETVRIEVTDDGPGMTPEVAARATERFMRGDSSRSRTTGGAGLGLAITAAIVDVHSGALAIESTVGEGTTVSIEFPV